MQSVKVLPRLSVVDGRLLRQYPRFMGIDIAKYGGWAATVVEKAADGKMVVVDNVRGHGKTFAQNTMLEMMKQHNINAVYYAAAMRMWAPPKPERMFYE